MDPRSCCNGPHSSGPTPRKQREKLSGLIETPFPSCSFALTLALSTPSQEPVPAVDSSPARWFADHIHVHDAALKAYLRQSFPDARHEVDDVVQESYLRIWTSRAGRPLLSAKAFLFKVARHVTLDLLRRNHISPIESVINVGSLAIVEDRPGVADSISIDEKIRLLVQGMGILPPRGREVVVLRKIKGLSQKETALQLGISEKTVDEHLYRSMKRLGKYLRQHGVSGLDSR